MRTVLVWILGWLAAVVLATAVGFAAVSVVGAEVGGIPDGIAVVSEQVPGSDSREGSSDDGSGSNERTPPVARTDKARTATQVTAGGSVTARCRGGVPRLLAWSPQNGWSVGTIADAGDVRDIVFTNGVEDVIVSVACASGPVFTTVTMPAGPGPTTEPPTEPTPTHEPVPTGSVGAGPAD